MTNSKWSGNSLNHLIKIWFFLSALTKADLNSFGKEPVWRDRFTMHVIMGTILSIQWGNRLEGMGSDWQIDFGEDNRSCLISSKDAGSNDKNVGGNLSDTKLEFRLINGRFNRRVLILSLKNELNWLTEYIEGEIYWDGFDRCNILSMEC